MHSFSNAYIVFFLTLLVLVSSMSFWFRDIISEGTMLGNHTAAVQKGLNLGVILFIVSEALFFMAIFWAFFHSALTPTVELGASWPPVGIDPVNPFEQGRNSKGHRRSIDGKGQIAGTFKRIIYQVYII